MLLNSLLQFFGGQVLQHLSPLPDAHARKCPCKELLEDDSELDAEQEEDTGADAASDREQDEQEPEFDFAHLDFEFQQEQEVVAGCFFFFLNFFTSEEAAIHGEDEANVSFMEKTATRGRCVFRWPQQADCYSVSTEVVFARNLTLAPSTSGQSFVVERPDDLLGRYEAFRIFLTK